MEYSQSASACQLDTRSRVDAWFRRARAALWPTTCVLCRREGQAELDLCRACECALPGNPIACAICAQPLAGNVLPLVCGACLKRPPRFQASCVPFKYAYPLDHLIRGIKYRGNVVHARVLGELLARHILAREVVERPQLLIPVPLASARFHERGYNQATELALRLKQRLKIPVRTDLLIRTRHTREQTALDGKQRRRNVRRAFAAIERIPARHVAIIDDVVTTGSTVNEVATVLRRAGVKRIEVWAVARAGQRMR